MQLDNLNLPKRLTRLEIYKSQFAFSPLSSFNDEKVYYVQGVSIRSFYGLYFPAFGLNTEAYSVSLHIQSERGKIRTRKTPNTDTFHAVVKVQALQ